VLVLTPGPYAGMTDIEVSVSTNSSANANATALAAALNTYPNLFSATATGAVVTVQYVLSGYTNAPADFGTGFTFAVLTPGSNSGIVLPTSFSCDFIVDHANGNGLGLRSLKNVKGNLVSNVYMNTSATPATGNPNPAAGLILVEFAAPFNQYNGGFYGFVAPVSGTPVAVDVTNLTPGKAYTIVSVGTSTLTDWETLGVPLGVVPAVGVTFIALVSGAGSGSGMVELPATAGANCGTIQALGDPNTTLNESNGASMVLACYSNSPVIAAPADGTVIGLTFYFQ
jgi:hypothetical protein